MSIKKMVAEYRFDDPTLNVTVGRPGENERASIARLITGNKSATRAVTGLGLTEVKISYEDWSVADLFE